MRRNQWKKLILGAMAIVFIWKYLFAGSTSPGIRIQDEGESFNHEMDNMDKFHDSDFGGFNKNEEQHPVGINKVEECYEDINKACYREGLRPGLKNFYLNDKPFTIMSGSFHYFRTLPEQWDDRLKRMRAAGLNTVTTYIAWNVHEKVKNHFQFGGRYDIAKFIQLAASNKLYVIVRAGPYICAEWEFGGLPAWLLSDRDMVFRSSTYKPYLDAVENYFSNLLPILEKLTYNQGGPIIAFQLENEFSHMGEVDYDYLRFLRDLHIKFGIKEMLFTSDASCCLRLGSLPGTYTTVNFGGNPSNHFAMLQQFQPNAPLMTTEFWPGWFDQWGDAEKHHIQPSRDTGKTITEILAMKASFNIYMFVGSTNFEFYSGGNKINGYHAITTSYDYDAPISEYGAITPKFKLLREILIAHGLADQEEMPAIPADPETETYGSVDFTEWMSYKETVPISQKAYRSKTGAKAMEMLGENFDGQAYGFILYRITVKGALKELVTGEVCDRAHVIINGKLLRIWDDWLTLQSGLRVDIPEEFIKDYNVIDILVENRGRINFASGQMIAQTLFQSQRKGILGDVQIDGQVVQDIEHVCLEFDDRFMSNLELHGKWSMVDQDSQTKIEIPVLYRGSFEITDKPKDTFLDTGTLGKGVAFVNGFNLGRYSEDGPQRTLYVPAPVLKLGKNEVIVFEHQSPGKVRNVVFVNTPELGPVNNR